MGTLWNAGAGPTQWIQVDLEGTYDVMRVRLIVAQDPAGRAVRAGETTTSPSWVAWKEIQVFGEPMP